MSRSTDVAVQGGAEVLGFATQEEKSARHAIITSLAGVISTSPFIEQATPAPKLLRWLGGKLSSVIPFVTVPVPINPAVRITCCATEALQPEMLLAESFS
jgi:hypothetical protein